jgi:hypothetical protein
MKRPHYPSRFLEAVEDVDDDDVAAALSARYSEEDYRKATAKALASGFDAIAEPEPLVREAPDPPPPPKPLPRWRNDQPVVRFGLGDFPGWAAWLLGELEAAWPAVSGVMFANQMRGWTASNAHHFIRTSNSVALAISVPHHFIGGTTVVRGVFCWSRFPDEEGAEHHLLTLHRHTIDWAQSQRALRFEFFERSDLSVRRGDFFLRPQQQAVRYVEMR